MSTMAARPPQVQTWALVRGGWERISIYLPIILMGVLAMGTYWLARNTPTAGLAEGQRAATHEPDYFMRDFSVKTFDEMGRLKSQVFGSEARHYPDTDTMEIDNPRIRSFNTRGELTVATARRAISNADGSEVQLIGDAVVMRDARGGPPGQERPRMEFRGEFLHAFFNTEQIKSNKPVQLLRGETRFTAESLDFDNLGQVLDLRGRVRATIVPQSQPPTRPRP
jgi:lipopolysaccharide export system protein LptC